MHTKLMCDKELVREYIKGDQKCFSVLMERHKSKVFSYIYMMVKDRAKAEDLFQDVFIKVIHTLKSGKYNEEGKFLPWVMRISHNLVIDYFRKEKKMPMAGNGKEEFDIFKVIRIEDQNVEDKLIKEQANIQVRKLINKLPKEQKEVLLMRHFGELSFNEIAEQTNVSINTALGRMRYALINMRKMMETQSASFEGLR
ncbi:MAG: sigma-70 family RNA polymerase sigma factor [Flavobacteriales bacterium]|nr:sigma-70 family RNA polymerase sigma factor [Flavobacteriales bacterium]